MEKTERKSGCCSSKSEHIKGIVCDVKNCEYHDCDTHCTAKQIMVGPTHAENSSQTACTTFKPRTE